MLFLIVWLTLLLGFLVSLLIRYPRGKSGAITGGLLGIFMVISLSQPNDWAYFVAFFLSWPIRPFVFAGEAFIHHTTYATGLMNGSAAFIFGYAILGTLLRLLYSKETPKKIKVAFSVLVLLAILCVFILTY